MKEIIIKLDNVDYEYIKNGCIVPIKIDTHIYDAIRNGKVLPKGHGRLIDADAFIEFLKHKEYGMIDYSDCVIDDITEDAPTIIEADTEDKE